MTWTLNGTILTQSDTDNGLAGLVAIAGVTSTPAPSGVRFYSIGSAITQVNINGTLSWDSDSECLILSDATRVEQAVGTVVTIGVVATVNGKTRYSRGTGLVLNRLNTALNTNSTTWWAKSSTSLALGSKLIINGGQIKTAGSIFLGTTTNPTGQYATIELNGRAELLNLAPGAVQVVRSFCQPDGIKLSSGILSGRTTNSTVFSSVGFGALAVEVDFASFQCDGNGQKDPVTVLNGVFADNKSATDYTYVTAGNSLNTINKYIFKGSDVGSALRTGGLGSGVWRQGVVELSKDVRFNITDLAGSAIENAVIYIKMLGASINPSGRYAGIDDYMTPRVYVGQSSASGLTPTTNILYAVAQGYATDGTGAGTPLTMDALTTRASDITDGFIWSYDHLLGQTTAEMRGNGVLTKSWTLFVDANKTLTRAAALAKLASSFTVNPTTKVVTVTASSTYDDLYDVLKAYKCSTVQAQIEAPVIGQTIVTANGTNLTSYTGWTLVVNSGVTFSVGAKFKYVYFSTITNNGAITGTYADSTGTRVNIVERTGKMLSTYVTINGVPVGGTVVPSSPIESYPGHFVEGWVPMAASRTITVQPTDQIRISASYYGSKPAIFNLLGTDMDAFTLSLDVEAAVDTTVDAVVRDEIANTFSTEEQETAEQEPRLIVQINRTLAQYTPSQVIAGLDFYIVSKGYAIHRAISAANTADLYLIKTGTIVTYSPNYIVAVSDFDADGNPNWPSEQGYEIPLVLYYQNPATGGRSKMTILNALGASVATAPWTQSQATIGTSDQAAIAAQASAQVWAAASRTLTSVSAPTAAQNATAVRSELAAELARLDVAVGTRATQTSVSAIPTNPLLTTDARLNTLDANISTRSTLAAGAAMTLTPAYDAAKNALPASSYTAPDNASISAIKAKTDTLVNGPTLVQIEASAVLAKEATVASRATQTSVNAIPTAPLLSADLRLNNLDAAVSTRLAASAYTAPSAAPTAAANAAAVRTELTTELARLDAAVSTRLPTTGYTAPSTPPTAAQVATATRTELAPELARLDAAVSTRSTLTAGQIPAGLTAAQVWSEPTRTLTSSSAPTAAQVATATRVELAPELARLDAAVSTRSTLTANQIPAGLSADQVWSAASRTLTSSSAPTAAQVATATRVELAPELARLDAAVSTRSTLTASQIPEGLTAAQVWASPSRTLTEAPGLTAGQAEQLRKVAALHGVGAQLVVTETRRTAGDVSQTIVTSDTGTTVSAA